MQDLGVIRRPSCHRQVREVERVGERDGSLRNSHQWGTAPTAAAGRALNQTEIGLHALTLTTTPCPSAAPLPNVIFTSPTLTPGTSPSQSQQSPSRITDRLPFPPPTATFFNHDETGTLPLLVNHPSPTRRLAGLETRGWHGLPKNDAAPFRVGAARLDAAASPAMAYMMTGRPRKPPRPSA